MNKKSKEILLLIGVIIFLFSIFNKKGKKVEFNITQWENNLSYRSEISDYLIKEKNLIGKDKKEIISLLGEPTYINMDIMYYKLGNDNYMNIDSNLLII